MSADILPSRLDDCLVKNDCIRLCSNDKSRALRTAISTRDNRGTKVFGTMYMSFASLRIFVYIRGELIPPEDGILRDLVSWLPRSHTVGWSVMRANASLTQISSTLSLNAIYSRGLFFV